MNKPVWEAISALQQTISTFSSDMLSADLIHSHAVLRSIRASSSLEDAQQAWARVLNLPGAGKVDRRWVRVDTKNEPETEVMGVGKIFTTRPLPAGEFYTHKDLWGRAPVAEAGARMRARGTVPS